MQSLPRYVLLMLCCVIAACAGKRQGTDSSDPLALETGRYIRKTLEHEGIEREYVLYLPGTYAKGKKLPLVIALHGYGGSATGFEQETSRGFNYLAERRGFVVVYPQASHYIAEDDAGQTTFVSSWNDLGGNRSSGPLGPLCAADAVQYPCAPECGRCGRCQWTACHDDLGFFRGLLRELALIPGIDLQRRYLVGFSNGATMTQRLACELENEFAAVVLVSGRLQRGYSCTPASPPPLLQINGDLDRTVPYDGSPSDDGYFYTSSRTVARDWAAAATCTRPPRSWPAAMQLETQGLACQVHGGCEQAGVEIVDCLWSGGEHVWPGNLQGGGWCTAAIQSGHIALPRCEIPAQDAESWGSELIWEFLSGRRR